MVHIANHQPMLTML